MSTILGKYGSRMDNFRIRVALYILPVVYPGPAGEMLVREIEVWQGYAHRFGHHVQIGRVIDDILTRGEKLNATKGNGAEVGSGSTGGDAGSAGRERDDDRSHDGRVQ